MKKSKEQLVKVFEETLEDLEKGYYTAPDKSTVKFNDSKLKRDSYFYNDEELKGPVVKEISGPEFETKIYVENIDSYLKAIEMGPKAAVLNMASSRNPGGGVTKGSKAQEEDLCRRSNLVVSLYSFSDRGRLSSKRLRSGCYPIPTYGGIYSPKVTIYRDTDYNTYQEPHYTNVISVAAMVRPEYDPETLQIKKSQVHIAKRKIRSILRIALLRGHTKLVLGAFGCGAFCNPPKHIAQLFKEVLSETEFFNVFEEICFAILDDGNTGKEHNPEGNYKPFLDVFGSKE